MTPWMKFLGALILLGLSGCHAVSPALRSQMDSNLRFADVLKNPEAHVGKKIILGGIIVKTQNLEGMTEIEMVQKELDAFGYPSLSEKSEGRFIFRVKGFLEPEIYERGREVTGAGTLGSPKAGKIGELSYIFPVLEAEELELWSRRYPPVYNPYYFSPFYGPPYSYPLYPQFYYW